MDRVGPYAISGVLGSGGFGTVYLAADPDGGADVAVKVLDRMDLSDPAWRVRMHAEAAAMCAVDDPHCVRVLAVIDEPGVAAIVSQFVDGASLRAVLTRYQRLTGPQALDVLIGALHGLAAVHRAGLVHGDVKPENILVDRRGVSYLIDFGLAAAPAGVASRDGHITGSPGYLSPEQIRGEPADVRSDIYACAVLLFELLCGVRPYAGPNVDAVLTAHTSAPVPDPRAVEPSITDAFARLCISGMAKDPALRPQSAAAFAAALEDAARSRYGAAWRAGLGLGALVGGGVATGVRAAQAAQVARIGRHGLRTTRRIAAVVGATGVATAVVVAVIVVTGSHGSDRRPPPAAAGRLLVVRSAGNRFPVVSRYQVVTPTGRVLRTITDRSPLPSGALGLAPDGKHVILVNEGSLSVETFGGRTRLLWASGTQGIGAAAWSPTGNQVAFSIDGGVRQYSDIDVINADGSGRRVVAHGVNVHSIAWSPDGRRLAFLQNQGGIWVVAVSGGQVRDVLPPGHQPNLLPVTLSWAPASHLLFDESGATPTGVWTVGADGSDPHVVLPAARSPSWAPDGRRFAAVRHGRVVIADASGTVERTIGPAGVQSVQWAGSG